MSRPITPETHPRLIAAMKWQGILSEGEAISALEDLRAKREGGCEAVAHYGGPRRLLVDTVRRRTTIRRMRAHEAGV